MTNTWFWMKFQTWTLSDMAFLSYTRSPHVDCDLRLRVLMEMFRDEHPEFMAILIPNWEWLPCPFHPAKRSRPNHAKLSMHAHGESTWYWKAQVRWLHQVTYTQSYRSMSSWWELDLKSEPRSLTFTSSGEVGWKRGGENSRRWHQYLHDH